MIGIKFDKDVRPLVLIIPKMKGYSKIFKVKNRDKDKSNKLISFHNRQWETIGKNIKLLGLRLKLKWYWIKCFASLWWQIYQN